MTAVTSDAPLNKYSSTYKYSPNGRTGAMEDLYSKRSGDPTNGCPSSISRIRSR